MEKNIVWFKGKISIEDREKLNGHKGYAIWFTGLPASGKSTIAHKLEEELYEKGCSTFVFDGDNIRHGLCQDLDFTDQGRDENIRRVAELVKLFVEAGIITISAFISPKIKHREAIRDIVGKERFVEVFVDCPPDICEKRDPKGLYKKARKGKINNFTGISLEYEKPVQPDIRICSDKNDVSSSVKTILDFILDHIFSNDYQIYA